MDLEKIMHRQLALDDSTPLKTKIEEQLRVQEIENIQAEKELMGMPDRIYLKKKKSK